MLFITVLLSSCTIVRKHQKGRPFVYKNTVEVKGGKFTSTEKGILKQRLLVQLDDSSKVIPKDIFFVIHVINNPPAYDSGYSGVSARNMKTSMLHIGYYNSSCSYSVDTITKRKVTISFRRRRFPWRTEIQKRVTVNYTLVAGNPTLIDTVSYALKESELQELALKSANRSYLRKGDPISKGNVLGEIARLVELYRNYGYYKFTSDDIKVRGDTSIAALTTISEDPFANLRLLAEANEARNKPTIKLAVVLNPATDSLRLRKYYINHVYIYPDYTSADATNDSAYTEIKTKNNFIIRYHKRLFRTSFITRQMLFKPGNVYSQEIYSKTINNFTQASVWQSSNITIVDLKDTALGKKDSIGKLDMIVQLIPAKKYGFEANIESSYSTNNTNIPGANLFGLSGNLSVQDRNLGKQGVKMTNAIKVGAELDLTAQQNSGRLINSNEYGFSNSFIFPKLVTPFGKINRRRLLSQQSFINTSLSYVKRIDLFNLQSLGLAMGYEWSNRPTRKWIFKPLDYQFSYLYNQSDSFITELNTIPYLKYSFNTALVMGSSIGYTSTVVNPKHINRQHTFKANLEESGLLLGQLGVFENYLRRFIKLDLEYTHTISYKKSSVAFHFFSGTGMPIGKDSSLPFFKQYFNGGSNSMRGWPIRSLGPGSRSLANYDSSNTFNDRTGDIKLEFNAEYRYNILSIIPNTLMLKGALFADVGNIWNFTRVGNGADSLQFQFANVYKQLGVDLGTGFRFDFNYFLIRFDLGFRFKRPEDESVNAGWKAPSIGFDDAFKKIFTKGENGDDQYRRWRYQNLNFSIGLSYPF
ncbi:MAG TPA: BamA/TamA family outer membrane protein [Ferruginibacter sp.]|nr:BamA/TamA family outer membrane protein [Ferruginibacter sp.]